MTKLLGEEVRFRCEVAGVGKKYPNELCIWSAEYLSQPSGLW